MQKSFKFFLISLFVGFFLFQDVFGAISFGITTGLAVHIFFHSNTTFMFREWALFLYSMNYLLSPAITYIVDPSQVTYPMKINSDQYFTLALPGFILFGLGMYSIRTKIFNPNFNEVKQSAIVNEKLLKQSLIVFLFFKILLPFIPGELNFIFYLISLLRFVSAFSLLSLDMRRNWYWLLIVLMVEIISAFKVALFHDLLMWIVFLGLFVVYSLKPKLTVKMIGAGLIISLIFFIQAIKSVYRDSVWRGGQEAGISVVSDVGSSRLSTDSLFSEGNLLVTLNRGNQAWIFASTVDNMDRNKNFQGLNIVGKYAEAALLPRFLAPNKLKSGDQEIFNEFSGHYLHEGTSMGLGIFADGYVAFGPTGVFLFSFFLGLFFSLTFKIVERWSRISPFYILLVLPLLSYAVRPDCELQTTITHLFKGILLYGFLVYLTRKRFTLDSQENKRKLLHLNLVKGNGPK